MDLERFRPGLVVIEAKRPDVTGFWVEHGYEVIKRYLPFDTVNEHYARRNETGIEPDAR